MPAAKTFQQVSLQHRLSDFLQAELLHTLGAYQIAGSKLEELREGLGDAQSSTTLGEVVDAAHRCDEHLRDALHHPGSSHATAVERKRHPSPFDKAPDQPTPNLLLRVSDFYSAAATALTIHRDAMINPNGRPRDPDGERLGELLAVIHDPQRRGNLSREQQVILVKGRLERTLHRLNEVNKLLPPSLRPPRRTAETIRDAADARGFREVLHDHMGVTRSPTALHLSVLEAMSDAHMWMHQAEHLGSQSFSTGLTRIPETHAEMDMALQRSLVLNTFVYATGRSTPWIFAENEEERDYVLEEYVKCCETLTPTYCMWIGNQLSLLALQRRAYTSWTLGQRDQAYRDFHKLIRLLRDLRQRVDRRAVRVPGTKTMIEGLMAIAEHHIGRIYRGQHAHRVALRYFNRASSHLKGWEEHDEIGRILRNSRWRLNLLISQGKANYELGRMKRSLLYYARAWRAFLLLAESESHSTANIEVVMEVVKWLALVKDDPELGKAELSRRLEPLVDQFETVYSPVHLRLLAADIMMRLGHLLFILKLPPIGWVPSADFSELPPDPDHALAHRCLLQAAALDPSSTLIAADLLKITRASEGTSWPGKPEGRPAIVGLDNQWPAGSGRFEQAARIIEYILQTWLAPPVEATATATGVGAGEIPNHLVIARGLLGSFLAHTDSSNVKLAQVYRYLMQKPRNLTRDLESTSPTIDFVCLRRYSSFFPFLPRPAAFRALGGGYFVQVREADPEAKPFGIAVDPGPNFLDNLYHCGYGLADIHMIVLTHDHADHTASVDALLALMGIRMKLGDETFDKSRRLTIVGNESVVKRYEYFNKPHPVKVNEDDEHIERDDAVRVMSFDTFYEISSLKGEERLKRVEGEEILLEPTSLCIEPIKTIDHYDATGYIAQGFLLEMGRKANKSSVLFTGDTGPIPPGLHQGKDPTGKRHYESSGDKTLAEAAATANVVVAHLSSVPLSELRKLAGFEANKAERDEITTEFAKRWEMAVEQAKAPGSGRQRHHDPAQTQTMPAKARIIDEEELEQKQRKLAVEGSESTRFLLQQLQFGFRSLSKHRGDLGVSPLSPLKEIKEQSEKHLYLSGLLELAEHMARNGSPERPPLLLIGELREELGTFRTRIASRVTNAVFRDSRPGAGSSGDHVRTGTALTADIGLRVRLSRPPKDTSDPTCAAAAPGRQSVDASVLCTTCDLDNDLIATERFHDPCSIREVCVKGENEGVFYNCALHDPGKQPEQLWVESVERFDVFGD